ncbi:MAG TPA: heme biosynthesis HemY N-terminal domain-containing protein [Steroidobacteraceae bacterium]|nr:heme biosynthesis HemY N-terminal domain-containing protein [Steroidobacteraceae bacterium]
MKGGLYIAAAAILGALLANLLLADPGYVALRFAGRLVEMSAVTFLLLLVATYFAVRLLARAISARQLWRRNQEQRRLERARRSLGQGLLELSEGEYDAAEKTLTRYTRDAENPVAHYLVAARAADLQGSTQRRDELLARALEASTDRRAPVLIMQAEMHLKHKQLASALATLEQLEASGESNARGLLLLSRVHRQTGQWQRLLEIEPRLRSTRGIPPAVADETVAQIYLDRLKAAGNAADLEQLGSAWKDMPKSLARRPDIVVSYARAAMACDEHHTAEAALRESIERAWDESTVATYGEIEADDPFKVLERAESWLPDHPEDAALLLTCARLATRAELYGKARTYLETSIAIKPRLEAYQLLASLMEQLGERERAVKALNDALAFAVGRKPKLPKIHTRRWLDRRQGDRRR